MDHHRFDAIIRAFAAGPSRRTLLRDLAVLSLGLCATRIPGAVEAKKRRKRKKRKKNSKKAKPNAFGCLSVNKPCKRASQCCSGNCTGKKGKRKCRAHDTGNCRQELTAICLSDFPLNTACNNSNDCFCVRTTAGSNYCAATIEPTGSKCADCRSDADCVAQGLPVGTACAPLSEGYCAGFCESGMGCMVPCGTVLPGAEPTP